MQNCTLVITDCYSSDTRQKTQLRNCSDNVTGNNKETALTNVTGGCKRGHTRGFDVHTKRGENSHIATVTGSRVGLVSAKEST